MPPQPAAADAGRGDALAELGALRTLARHRESAYNPRFGGHGNGRGRPALPRQELAATG